MTATDTPEVTRGCVIITGASRGIGRSVALELARHGYAIAGCFTREGAHVDELAETLEGTGAGTFLRVCDVRDLGAVNTFVADAERELGPPTALVNNAGITADRPIVLMAQDDWQSVIDTNLTGTWNFCRAVSSRMMKRRTGAIVNLSSVAGIHGNAGQTNYAAAKAGIIGMSKSLAKEVAAHGIRVNVVAPGFIETDLTAAVNEKVRQKTLTMIPMRRFGSTADVAGVVRFLLSDEAAYITGQVLQVDGGVAF